MPTAALFFSSPAASSAASLPPDSSSSSYTKRSPPPQPWVLSSGGVVKMPTAPWMRSPLLLPAHRVLEPSNPQKNKTKKDNPRFDGDRSLTDKVRGGRSRHAMLGIIRNIKNLRNYNPPGAADDDNGENSDETGFGVLAEVEADEERRRKAPWVAAKEEMVFKREKKMREVTAAELTLPQDLLVRLRSEGRRMRKWVRAKKAGITEEVVEEIRRTWMKEELAMVRIVEPLRRNMDRAREIVEIKSGGLVVWSKRDVLVVYRGLNYPLFLNGFSSHISDRGSSPSNLNFDMHMNDCTSLPTKSNGITDGFMLQKVSEAKNFNASQIGDELINESLYKREANRLLDGLGPRFIDWWWNKPLPVDADLLPEVVPDFKTPFRLCPPNIRLKLSDDELTYLRKLARPLPTHFVLGKNRKLQGLAAAIIKLWERSLIAKVAVKVGIPGTNNEQMSLELKRLTGGVLILRNKFFIILYRGKDFLPSGVATMVTGREKELNGEQVKEEEARLKATRSLNAIGEMVSCSSIVGTYTEFQDIETNNVSLNNSSFSSQLQVEAEKEKLEKELKEQERKLITLKQKIQKSEEELANLSWRPSERVADQELLTEEERQSLRKKGLRMDKYLLLGRRGIYDSVIGSIHQHWKHRDVVKVITRQKALHQITHTARLLETESGGILVAVEKLNTSYAIILYRGKNYHRPSKLFPANLLTKREALHRSIEIQRRGSLKYFAHQREQSVWDSRKRLRDLQQNTMAIPSGDCQEPE